MGQEIAIGIDTGGTFTDVIRLGASRVATKVPSTPDDPARAVLEALAAVGGFPRGGRLHHGSTVGTNTVLTRTGARVLFATTQGFEDVLHLDRGQRAELHALVPSRPAPLVPGERCLGVAERLDASGRIVRPISEDDAVSEIVAAVRASRAEAVALCLVHAVSAPRHERRVARALRRALRAEGVTVHASAEISADAREAERAATVVLDAYVAPRVVDYVGRIARALPRGALTVMRSDGGRMSPSEVRRAPVRTLLSGPAGGVAAAHAFLRSLGGEHALSFDVGGTSTDVAWLDGADLPVRGRLEVGAHTAAVPSLAVETVGAGGGSVVRVDAGGALRVGPASAGAVPGPACYGQGGPFTLSDAWLLLGRLPEGLLAGDFPLDVAAAERAARPLSREAGCSVRALAEGAVQVAAATTARALRRASVRRGHDPRGATLIAFGGAGPLLGAETAQLLDLRAVAVPADPGTFAAEGALLAPLRVDASGGVATDRDAELERVRVGLEREVRGRLSREGARRVEIRSEVDARYEGQAFEVTVPLGMGWRTTFHRAHERRYGFATPTRRVEPVRLRVRGAGYEGRHAGSRRTKRGTAAPGTLWDDGGRVARTALGPRDRVRGPARIEERTGTTWVPGGWEAVVIDHDGALRLERYP